METVTERLITYQYGPESMVIPFTNTVGGVYTWDQLISFIEEDRWGSGYTITSRKERTVIYGDWEEL